MANTVVFGLAIFTLVVGLGAAGLAGYVFFIVLPPKLDTINTAAYNLINFYPSSDQSLHDGANALRGLGNSFDSVGNAFLGIPNLFTNQAFHSAANQVAHLADSLDTVGDDVTHTVTVVHNVGVGALGMKDGLYWGVLTLLVMGGAVILIGITLVVIGNALPQAANRISQKVGADSTKQEKIKGSMTEHEPESLIKVDKEIKVVEKYCTTCGRKMTIDAGFCPSCGIAQNTIN